MRCPVCGAPIALGATRCAICGHGLERPAGAPGGSSDRASEIFVGRERELALLGEALDDALDGHGRLVLLAGEPGIGKTRLAAELSALAHRRGARVLVGRACETEGAPPYWPWAQVLRALLAEPDVDTVRGEIAPYAEDLAHLVPELGGLVPGATPAAGVAEEEARFRFFASFARWLDVSSRHRPLVLVLDDLHWFDTPSLRLLELVARELEGAPVLIVGAYRDAGLQSDHALSQLVGAVVRESFCRRVELGGLPAADVARLVEHAIGEPAAATLVGAMVEKTEGNPFFLTETLRLLVAERRSPPEAGAHRLAPSVPHGVRAAIGRRLEGLSAPCRKVLLLAAMLGREFGAPALETLGAQHSLGPTGEWLHEALEEAVEARLIAVVPRAIGRYSFTHALIREALYEELNPARRARLHRDIAPVVEALAALEPNTPPPAGAGRFLAEVAYHHLQALPAGGDIDRAVAYAMRAGDWAMEVLAYEDAVLHYRRAQDALDAGVPNDARRAELLLRLGHAAAKAGDVDLAHAAFERTLELARGLRGQSPAALLFARAVLGLGGEWWMELSLLSAPCPVRLDGDAGGERNSEQRSSHGGIDMRHDGLTTRHGGATRRRFVARVLGGMAVVGLLLAGLAGCARTSVENVSVKATGLPKPRLVIVHDFGVSPSAVALDTAIGARLIEAVRGNPEAEAQLKIGQSVARVVTENLVQEIGKLGIPAVEAAKATPVAGPSLSIEGQFLTVDQGNRLRRAVVGFGAGASEVRTLVQVFETTNDGRRLVEDFYITVKSSRKPGFGPMAGVGAAAGHAATSAAVSTGVGIATAHSQTVEGDAKNTADEITKVLKKFFVEQGWIAP